MSKRHADSTPDEKAPKRRKISADEVLVEAARNGDTTAVRAGLEKLRPDTDSKTVAFDAVHEACRGNHDECLALLLPYVETTQMGFGMLLSECIHADHTACTEVLLQHWKSVCSNVAFVPHGQEEEADQPCPAMWEDPAVCQVFIDAGADIETKDDLGRSSLQLACRSGALAVVKMLVKAGAGVCVTDHEGDTCLLSTAAHGHTETVRYLVSLKDVDVNRKVDDCLSALHAAVEHKHAAVVEVLIDAGADIEAKDHMGRSSLHLACRSGSLAVVKMLVKAGAKVCVKGRNGDTCLFSTAARGHTETVRYLVGLKDVDVNRKADERCSALHAAVEHKHAAVVEVLIDAGADIEAKDHMGHSSLHFACRSGSLAIVKMLVKAGVEVRATDNEGDTCLTLAAYFGRTETVRYLVGLKDVDVNHKADDCLSVLHAAVEHKHAAVVEVLIDAGADIEAKDEDGCSPLLFASSSGHLDIVKLLVKAGAEVRAIGQDGDTCLILAAAFGHTETVRYLLGLPEVDVNRKNNLGKTALVCTHNPHALQVLIDAGADIEAKNNIGRSALHLASENGELAIIKVLVKAGAGVRVTDNEGDTCLILAANFGHTETVRYLVALPEVDVNHRGSGGDTALYIASHKVFADVVELLIDAGADIEVTDDKGRSPLHTACLNGNIAVVKMLVKAGAEVRATDNEGSTCLHIASYYGRTETLRYIAGLPGVDVNHADENGMTALHWEGKKKGHPAVVQALVDAGADLEAKNSLGRSPLLVACESRKIAIVKLLVKAGAEVRTTDSVGNTCLMLASYFGHTEIMSYLVGLPEVDVHHAANGGETALHVASRRHGHRVAQVLLYPNASEVTPMEIQLS